MKTLKDYEYFRTENGVLYCGDNLEVLSLLAHEKNSFDLCLTSPPYDNLRDYKGYNFNFENLVTELILNTQQGSVIVWIVGDSVINESETGNSFKQALYFKERGFNIHDTMIYQKNSYPFPPSNRYFNVFEYMFVLSMGKPKTTNLIRVKTKNNRNSYSTHRQENGETKKSKYEVGKDTRIKENVWVYECGYMKSTKDKIAFEHPAIFPEQLAQDHIVSWTNKNDLVLDCFMGSGTTAIACEKLNRKWIGIEISEKYCEIAKKRIEEYTNQLKLFK